MLLLIPSLAWLVAEVEGKFYLIETAAAKDVREDHHDHNVVPSLHNGLRNTTVKPVIKHDFDYEEDDNSPATQEPVHFNMTNINALNPDLNPMY